MHQILYRKKRMKLSFQLIILINFDFFSSGIFHFVKDNYFRTSSSSSEDEYDSDDSARKGENAPTLAANTTSKVQPLGVPLANATNIATAAPAAGSDGNK